MSVTIYFLSLIISIWAVTAGKKRFNSRAIPVLGWIVLTINILVPVISFTAGVIDGMKAAG
ncbi:MAG: hypothetical protein K0Q90_139 [Paenibacillaceae bacterium]|jgi:hypothetical protein|nr:hypothetical protein [Paenibacillaceae bacterium]